MRPLAQTDRLIDGDFPCCRPEEQGISSRAILTFLDDISRGGYELHGLEIVRNGYLILRYAPKPLNPHALHRVYSSAKAGVIATAALFAIQEGKLAFDDRLSDVFPECVPPDIGALARSVMVYDLLNMATGHDDNTLFYRVRETDDWVRAFLSAEPRHVPGTVFYYNNCAPHMVSNAIRRVTGQWMHDYLKPRFLDPLGIQLFVDFNWTGDLEPTTCCMSLHSMAKIAQFYLQNGVWDGKRLLRADLAGRMGKRHAPYPLYPEERATAPADVLNADLVFGGGYGLYGSVAAGGVTFEGGMSNHGMFFRTENIACALFGNDRRNDDIKKLFYRDILFHAYERPLPDDGWYDALQKRLPTLSLAPDGESASDTAAFASGRTYRFDPNGLGLTAIRFDFEGDRARIAVFGKDGETVGDCGLNGDWGESDRYLIVPPDSSCSAKMRGYEPDRQYGYGQDRVLHSGAWTSDDTFTFHSRSLALSSTIRCDCRFTGRRLKLTVNPHFLPSPVLEDRLVRLFAWQA